MNPAERANEPTLLTQNNEPNPNPINLSVFNRIVSYCYISFANHY